MFRDARDAALQQADDLRRELDQVKAENDAMREALIAKGAETAYVTDPYRRPTAMFSDGERAALSHHSLKPFPVWAAVLLHLLTFGLFSIAHFGVQHDRLPRATEDDPSAAKAIGFTFLPYFNFYWVVFQSLRLADRLNLQCRLRGLEPRVSRNYVLFASVLSVIPYVNLVLGVFVWAFGVARLQKVINELAAMPNAAVTAGETTGVRVDATSGAPITPTHASAAEPGADASIRIPGAAS